MLAFNRYGRRFKERESTLCSPFLVASRPFTDPCCFFNNSGSAASMSESLLCPKTNLIALKGKCIFDKRRLFERERLLARHLRYFSVILYRFFCTYLA